MLKLFTVMIKKTFLTSLTLGFLIAISAPLQAQSNQDIEVIIDNDLTINDYKLSPSRIPYIFADLSNAEKQSFVIYGLISSIANDGSWVRISTNEQVDDIHFYVQASNGSTFNQSMQGKYITAKGNLHEIILDESGLNEKNSSSTSFNNLSNPHNNTTQTYQLDANAILVSSPF